MPKNSRSVKFTGAFLQTLEKILNIKFEISGEENIPKDKSIIFAPNHFTRFETMVVPYILNKIHDLNYCRSLAYYELFVGKLKEYLLSVQTLSTAEPNRDKIIIDDLIHKRYNWIVYPEGHMMKEKKIFTTKPNILKHNKMLKSSGKTGVSVLAMKAEFEAKTKGQIYICPVTISYRPLHAKRNNLYLMLSRFLRSTKLPKQIKEELFVESSLLMFATISIEFGKAICVRDYIHENTKLLRLAPIPEVNKRQLFINTLRYPLTNKLMHRIYIRTPLSFDHFFSFAIFNLIAVGVEKISLEHLREILFHLIAKANILNYREEGERFRISTSINTWNTPDILLQKENFDLYNFVLKELELKSLGFAKMNVLYLNKENLLEDYDVNEVRIKNIFKVLFNEFSYFAKIISRIYDTFLKSPERIKKENTSLLEELMEIDYLLDRRIDEKSCKEYNLSKPEFFTGSKPCGVLISHGFRSSAGEVKDLAKYINNAGFNYTLRLKGHGTTPEDMKKCKMEDWIKSYNIGYYILSRKVEKVFLCGFSMGGLLTLLNSKILPNIGIITISAPLKVASFKLQFAGIAKELTGIIKAFSSETKDYIESKPEYPDTNYSATYFSSLNELRKIIKTSADALPEVLSPALIIQGMEDPTVDPKSGMEIYKKIASTEKELFQPNLGKRHVIIRGAGAEKVFEAMLKFINSKFLQ